MTAAGIARIMQTGWFKEMRVKDLDSHSVRALLARRGLLVATRMLRRRFLLQGLDLNSSRKGVLPSPKSKIDLASNGQ